MTYKLERNVAMPTRKAKHSKYPFRDMKVNDSFEFDPEECPRVRAAASHFGSRNNMLFSVRKINPAKARCWRVK